MAKAPGVERRWMMRNDFVALILSHGRADNVKTFDSLRKHGYTGRIVIVIDNEDDQAQDYYSIFGRDNVVMFDKAAYSECMDEGDNFEKRGVIIYARNVCFDIARNLGYKYFIELDDDYQSFSYRHDSTGVFREKNCYQLDQVFELMVYFLELDKRIKSVCITQHGDYVGGAGGSFGDIKLHRKAMNSFVCSVERPFKFVGRINEDVTTYTTNGSRGELFFTLPTLCLGQTTTQANAGGMSDAYLQSGTYLKSFYSVMYSPSCVKISAMGAVDKRIHHQVTWKFAVPKILQEKWRKV